MAEPETEMEAPPPRRRRKRSLAAKWGLGLLAAIALAIVGAGVILNTPLGERFLAERIARETFPNGLNIRIGRIEGNLYGAAVLHDVVLSDPQGAFLTIPRAEVDWNPGAWVNNTLDIDSFVARRATMIRVPEFLPSEEEGPILPGFDISIDRLEIDNLTLAAGIAGDEARRVDLGAQVQVENRRLFVDADGTVGSGERLDRIDLLLDAEPDGDNFDLALDYDASSDGALAALLGARAPYSARIRGDGTWSRWDGAFVARRGEDRFASLRLTNRRGTFGVLGKVYPSGAVEGLLAKLLGSDVSVAAAATIDNRVLDGSYTIVGGGARARAEGVIDLADNRLGNLDVQARLTDPGLLGPDASLEGTRLAATLDGPFSDLAVVHDLDVERLTVSGIEFDRLSQSGTARYDGTRWTLPLNLMVERIASGSELVDPRLVDGTGRGTLILTGSRLLADDLRLQFPGTTANFALRGDLSRGSYEVAGPVRAERLVLDDVGAASGTAVVNFVIGSGIPWRLGADLDATIAPVTNDTLANLGGEPIRVRGRVATGSAAPIEFDDLRVDSNKLELALDGDVTEGTTSLAGAGRHTDYGPFTVEAKIAEAGPEAMLVFDRPVTGLENVRLAIAPTEKGFAIDAEGGSVLGPFAGRLGLVAPENGPTQLGIERLTLSDTDITGDLLLVDGGARGDLAFSGGGLSGTVALAPRDGGQGLAIDLTARNANFGGTTPIAIGRADIDATGLIGDGTTSFAGRGTAQGLSYGRLFIGRIAARGEVTDGVGQVDATLSGRRGSRFDLDLNARFRPERVAVALQGEFAGKRIEMPRRAVLSSLDGGGWRLRPTQISYGGGGMIAAGQYANQSLAMDLKLSEVPLSLIDIVTSDIGLGGTVSGVVDYRAGRGQLPVGSARVKIDDLTRSGLVLSSRPVDVSLVARLTEERLETRALLKNEDIRTGRMQALITGMPQSGILLDRLREGRLFAQLRYSGLAETLWRLSAVDAFDITGPVRLAANATGTIADPTVQGSVSSDELRVRSSISGTDIRDVAVRGRFIGSRLQLRRFAGKTENGGSIVGSGIVDLEGLGERVEGRFLEIRGPRLDLRASATRAQLLDASGLSATISGPLRIISNGLGGTIAGRVRIDRASWTLGTAADDMRLPRISTREINRPADREPTIASGRAWRYLIDARGSSRIDVDGMGLDSEWGADIILRGTTDDPRIGGSAEVVRGAYSFAGTRFELTRGKIEFDENVPIDPRLDILAETDRDGLSVEAAVRGSATQPEITFSSTPALPEEEILARLLFGGSITSLSATDALQLGAALASLRGGGGMDPINQLRSAIGLDRLRIVAADPALNRGTGVALGKNIGRRFYVELITDGRGYSATELEFRVTGWLSLLAAVSTIGRESVVAEVSKDY